MREGGWLHSVTNSEGGGWSQGRPVGQKATPQHTLFPKEPIVPALAGPGELPALREVGQGVEGLSGGAGGGEPCLRNLLGAPGGEGLGVGWQARAAQRWLVLRSPCARSLVTSPASEGRGCTPSREPGSAPGLQRLRRTPVPAEARPEVRAECCVSPQGGSCRSLLASFASRRRRRPL